MSSIFEDEERIELRPTERIAVLLGEEKQREELKEISEFELNEKTLQQFYYIIKKELSKDLLFMSQIADKKLKEYAVHPDFNKFFKSPLETDQMKKKDEMDAMIQPYGLLKGDMIRSISNIMSQDREFMAVLSLYIDVSLEAMKKLFLFSMNVNKPVTRPAAIAEKIDALKNEFGVEKSDRAFLMMSDGKTNKEIAEALLIPAEQVSSYIRSGRNKALRLGITKPPKSNDDEIMRPNDVSYNENDVSKQPVEA